MKRWLLVGGGLAAAVMGGFVAQRARWRAHDALPEVPPVQVQRDGRSVGRIDHDLLRSTVPDAADASSRAWRLKRLLPNAALGQDGSVLVEDGQGLRFVLSTPPDLAQGREPFVALDSRGHLRVLLASGSDVLASLEGRDGRREQHATDAARDRTIARIILVTGGGDEELAGSPVSISAVVDGRPGVEWTQRDLAAVRQLDVVPADGEGHRAAWSLRDLAHALVGDRARVLAVVGSSDERVDLGNGEWEDTSRVPILRENRRGRIKFEWVDRDLSPARGERLREVTSVVLTSGQSP